MAVTTQGLRSVALAVVGLGVGTRPVAAHGSGTAGGGIVSLPVALAIVTLLGVSAGVVTAFGRNRSQGPTRLVGRAVGPLLVGIGGWAVVSVAVSRPGLGLGGAAIGLLGGVLFATRGRCDNVAIGAIAVHRFVEGVALAALSVAGSTVGLVGLVILSAHTVAECVAVGGQPARSRPRAVGAVLLITGVFVAGAGLGTIGLVVVPAAPRMGVVATVGGLLVAVGLAESRPTHTKRSDTCTSA